MFRTSVGALEPATPASGSVEVLDEASVLDALMSNRRTKNLAEAWDLVLVVRYCGLNCLPETIETSAGPRVPGSERMVRLGGEGTPRVREFAIADLAARMRRSTWATRSLVADALDLRYRMPLVWRRLIGGDVEVWRARQIATATRALSPLAARRVDARVQDLVDTIGPKRLQSIVQAAVIAADPEQAEAIAEGARDDRQVTIAPSSDRGNKDVFIRAAAADVIRFDGSVDRVAELLGLDGDRDSKQIRRAKAIGVLADPMVALDLFERPATRLAVTRTASSTSSTTEEPIRSRQPESASSEGQKP